MSSPIARSSKSVSDKILINIHQKVSHSERVKVLSGILADEIRGLINDGCISSAPKVLDIGCGDLSLSELAVSSIDGAALTCVDLYPVPEEWLEVEAKWNKYSQFNGIDLLYDDKAFDVGLLSDVLHHAGKSDGKALVQNALGKCRYLIIKDHFEYGLVSRHMLRAMDFVGNYGYGVSVPRRYFSRKSFEVFCSEVGAEIVYLKVGFDLYNKLPGINILLSPKWQFVAVCKAKQ